MTTMNLYNDNSPIFVQGMMGGGTGIIWNLIQSHPECSGMGMETNEAFAFNYFDLIKRTLRRQFFYSKNFLRLAKVGIATGCNPTKVNSILFESEPPANLSKLMNIKQAKFVDKHLYNLKMLKLSDPIDCMQYPNKPYTYESLSKTRLVAKNNEGLCMYANWFKTIYPQAKFISIVRDGYAICESQIRHGRTSGINEITNRYDMYINQMLLQAEQAPDSYMVIRYEDLVSDTIHQLEKVYAFLGLNLSVDQQFSMLIRNFIGKEDTFLGGKKVKQKYWLTLDELGEFFQKDINRKALEVLTDKQKHQIKERCGSVLDKLNYTG